MPRYRRHRTDYHSHPATAGLSSLARDLMWYAIERGGLLGVVEHSPRRLASVVGFVAPGMPCTVEHVEAALGELESSGAAVWWPEVETLWIVECADEQAKGKKAKAGCASQLAELPERVSDRISERYPEFSFRTDQLYQGVEAAGSPHPAPDPVTDPVTDPVNQEPARKVPLTAVQIWERLVPVLQEICPRPWDFGLTPPPGLNELISDGWGYDRIEDRCREIAAACEDGRIDPRWFRWQMFELRNWRILADELQAPRRKVGHHRHTGREKYAGGKVDI